MDFYPLNVGRLQHLPSDDLDDMSPSHGMNHECALSRPEEIVNADSTLTVAPVTEAIATLEASSVGEAGPIDQQP